VNADRDRDRLLENALTRELRAGDLTPASASCLDAETLAAWLDGGLDARSIAMAQAHASNCTRCQALLGTAIKTAPAVPTAEAHGARLWRWWLAPLAATAAAVTVWVVVPQRPLSAPTAAPVAESAAPESSLAKAEPPATISAPAVRQERTIVERDRSDAAPPPPAPAEAPKRTESVAEGRLAAAAPPAAVMREQVGAMADAQVTARSTPSPSVIWLVGRAGLVQLTTDGLTFLRVPFPEAVDLTAVTATDERYAIVTTADGRRFQTADGGRTWRLRP